MKGFFDKLRPLFSKGGKLHMFHSVFDGFETFLLVPNSTRRTGVHVHDSADSKRLLIMVVIALIPAMLWGMYNLGFQHYLAHNALEGTSWFTLWLYGFCATLPKILVVYIVGLGIEFASAQRHGTEIHEGFIVTGFLIPMIVPVETPLWTLAIATAFAVIFAKEVFGGTGYNIFNVAIVARAILFFAYPTKMTGSDVFVRTSSTWGIGANGALIDGFSGATPLGQVATAVGNKMPDIHNIIGEPLTRMDAFWGFIPGSMGEVSTFCILLGGLLLLLTGVASYKIVVGGLVGALGMTLLFNAIGTTPAMNMPFVDHLLFGGFLFGLVFMATDPVTSARTERGKWYSGLFVGVICVFIRVLNPGYPEGMMLAILLMNVFSPLFDYFVIDSNIKMRRKRALRAQQAIAASKNAN